MLKRMKIEFETGTPLPFILTEQASSRPSFVSVSAYSPRQRYLVPSRVSLTVLFRVDPQSWEPDFTARQFRHSIGSARFRPGYVL